MKKKDLSNPVFDPKQILEQDHLGHLAKELILAALPKVRLTLKMLEIQEKEHLETLSNSIPEDYATFEYNRVLTEIYQTDFKQVNFGEAAKLGQQTFTILNLGLANRNDIPSSITQKLNHFYAYLQAHFIEN